MHLRLLGCGRAIRIDDHQLGTSFALGLGDVMHHIDLGTHRIAAPDHDEIAVDHLARVHAPFHPGTGIPACVHQGDTDCGMLARVFHRVTQTLDTVALHKPHRAGIEVRPYRLGAVARGRVGEPLRHFVQGSVPGQRLKRLYSFALRTHAAQRHAQALRMVHALRITRHLGTDDTRCVIVVPSSVQPSHGVGIQTLDL